MTSSTVNPLRPESKRVAWIPRAFSVWYFDMYLGNALNDGLLGPAAVNGQLLVFITQPLAGFTDAMVSSSGCSPCQSTALVLPSTGRV
jgi:hypothetical protein